MSKFSTKKFLKDREKSTQRSKSGELDILKTPTKLGVAIEIIRKRLHTQYELAEDCNHKLACGCRLPSNKRNKPECEGCL